MKKKIIFISALILLLIFFPGCKKKENVDVVGKTFYLNEDNEIDFDTYIIFDMDYCGINYYTGSYDSYFFHYVYEIKGNNIYIYFKDFTIEGIINDSNMIISYQEKDYYFCESFLTPLPPKFMDLQGVYYLVNKESLSVLDFTLDFTNYLFDKFISMIDDTRHACQILGYTNEEIIDYIDSEEPYDKAGAYAIQSSFCKFVKKIEGSYMGIVGLPIDRIYQILKENEII